MIQEDDNLLLIGKAEDEFSSVEVHGKWLVFYFLSISAGL